MCLSIHLISDAPLPDPKGEGEFAELHVNQVEDANVVFLSQLRQIVTAPFVHSIGPCNHCGCHFEYESREQMEISIFETIHPLGQQDAEPNPEKEEETRRTQQTFWERLQVAMDSFRRYVERHIEGNKLVLHVGWEMTVLPIVERHTVSPSFFGGPCFTRLPENSVYTIAKEDRDATFENRNEAAARRVIESARRAGVELEPLRSASRFATDNRHIHVWIVGDSIGYGMKGAITVLPDDVKSIAKSFHGMWTEYGMLDNADDAFHFIKSWLLDGSEIDDLPCPLRERVGREIG